LWGIVAKVCDGRLLHVLLSFNYLRSEFTSTNQGVASSNLAGRAKFNYLEPVYTGFIFCRVPLWAFHAATFS